jgi:transcriptional regulator with XRE-family HTH domain
MFERRINPIELDRLLAEGFSQNETARRMGFSKQAVSQFLQKRKQHEQGIKNLPAKTPKSEFEGTRLLKRVMSIVIAELRYLDKKMSEITEDHQENRPSLNFQRLKYLAEARKQIALVLEIDKERFGIEEVLKFQNFVLEKIGEIDEQTRDQIIEGLRRGKSLRRVLEQG